VNPCHRPASLPRRRGAAAAKNEKRIIGIEQRLGGVEDALVETGNKAVFGRAQDERSLRRCCVVYGCRFGQEE